MITGIRMGLASQIMVLKCGAFIPWRGISRNLVKILTQNIIIPGTILGFGAISIC